MSSLDETSKNQETATKIEQEQQETKETEQNKEEKNPFEGQMEIKIDYQLGYKDLFEGFSLMNLKKSKSDTIKKVVVVAVALVGMFLMYTGTTLPGIIIFTLGLYFVLRDVIGPVVYRHRVSKIISSRKDRYTAQFYPTGFRITEKDKHSNILYSDVVWKELKNVHALEYKGKLIILPKRYLERHINDILTLAKRYLIDYQN